MHLKAKALRMMKYASSMNRLNREDGDETARHNGHGTLFIRFGSRFWSSMIPST